MPAGGPSGPIVTRQPVGIGYDPASNRLIVSFPRNFPRFGDFSPEVWVLTNANGLGGPPVWIQLGTTGTPPRSNVNESSNYDPATNRLIVYGGCFANCSPALRDHFVLSNANGLGGIPTWTTVSLGAGFGGNNRVDHSAVYDSANNLLIAFAGHFAFFSTDQNDTRTLSNADGTGGASVWTTLPTLGGPPPIRNDHTAVYDASSNVMTVYAGGPSSSDFYPGERAATSLTTTGTSGL